MATPWHDALEEGIRGAERYVGCGWGDERFEDGGVGHGVEEEGDSFHGS